MNNPTQQQSRLGDIRSSTPGRGERQWTSQANDSRPFKFTGAEWKYSGEVNRDPIFGEPQMLSDVSHRGGGRIDSARNHQIYGGTTADREYEAQLQADAARRERRAQQEGRLMKMVTSKADYQQAVRDETAAAFAQQQQALADQQRESARHDRQVAAEGFQAETAQVASLMQQKSARRTMAQQVAQEQLAQMQARKSMTLGERAAEKAQAQQLAETDTHWEARFGRSLR